MEQEESAPAEIASPPQRGIDETTLSALAILRVQETAPPDLWDKLPVETRRQWLRISGQPQGWGPHAWSGLPRVTQRDLRTRMREILNLFGTIGADLAAK